VSARVGAKVDVEGGSAVAVGNGEGKDAAVRVGGGGLIWLITVAPNNAEARESVNSANEMASHLQPQRMRVWRVR